ncbi:hypothetical protein JHD50_02215 [Sulfurimonas sp. MAG313]|nr:hypothetical protein [Sulfurimonas sp. MAG313]MDF1880126.1 hypothetical protein [Sulfurimonas sp. MAG313]
MSEQAKLLEEMQSIIMVILKSGSATQEQGDEIDRLEALLHKQKCFIEITHDKYTYQGEEIAGLFFTDKKSKAIDKMLEYEISLEDFFGFVSYHYDEDDDEELLKIFTDAFNTEVAEAYHLKSQSI